MIKLTKEQYNSLPDHLKQYVKSTEDLIGWKGALKPAHEPICMARKPFKGSAVDNVLKHGTGVLNIDESRIEYEDESDKKSASFGRSENTHSSINAELQLDYGSRTVVEANNKGRYPSNVLGEVEGQQKFFFNPSFDPLADKDHYFYCPKVSRKERHIGFDEIPYQGNSTPGGMYGEHQAAARKKQSNKGNNHPTVKPVALMSYLIKLITPPNGKVLDPFNGSGSTGMAAVELGFDYTGIELDPRYCKIAESRIEAWYKSLKEQDEPKITTNYGDLFEK